MIDEAQHAALSGFYEETSGRTAEQLQIVTPENALEDDLLSWAILPHGETMNGDSSRGDYLFNYQLGEHLKSGVYVLRVTARDASRREHGIEIAAALAASGGPFSEGREEGFVPMGFISKRVHFTALRDGAAEHYHGTAFGRLEFGDPDNLPHRRLFGATV